MNHFYFFSYGSNLLFERIQKRTPSVAFIKKFKLDQFELVFNKKGQDGSAKANVMPSRNGSAVYGTIKRIKIEEKEYLDLAEGLGYGYDLAYFETKVNGRTTSVGYYIATAEQYLMDGKPYDWYLDYVRFGAQQHQLPQAYVSRLSSVDYTIDTDKERRSEHDLVLANYR